MTAPVRHATRLETLSVRVPLDAADAFEAALGTVCGAVGAFIDEASGEWTIEGVKEAGARENDLAGALSLAEALSGIAPELARRDTPADGWLARSYSGFPEQRIGRRFAIRGRHLPPQRRFGVLTIVLDAGVAFGSGEHGSTRGCLRGLEMLAYTRPSRVLDLGTGSGILAMAAAELLRGNTRVLATDLDPWSVRTARANARRNGLSNRVHFAQSDGWNGLPIRRFAPYELVFANILARPLCRMAAPLARNLAPGGTVILSGLLKTQSRWVQAAHRRRGLVLRRAIDEGPWTTLVMRRRG